MGADAEFTDTSDPVYQDWDPNNEMLWDETESYYDEDGNKIMTEPWDDVYDGDEGEGGMPSVEISGDGFNVDLDLDEGSLDAEAMGYNVYTFSNETGEGLAIESEDLNGRTVGDMEGLEWT